MPDYKSFASIAKSRFRVTAAELGYEQITGTVYARGRGGWHESFALQASSGVAFFYVNYGISIPDLCPVDPDQSILTSGLLLGQRLPDVDGSGAFSRETVDDVEASAARVLQQYKAHALPWFASMDSLDSIAAEYLRVSPISEARIGDHSSGFGEGGRSATYGFLLLKAGRPRDALRWLQEAHRILSLPEYITADGRLVHEREKHARLQKPDASTIDTLAHVAQTIRLVGPAA